MRLNKVYHFYNEHAKRSDPADLWGQVKRSINGQVVGRDQIEMIVSATLAGLKLSPHDFLLDLCCGNGALSDRIFEHCTGGVGVDFADYLIETARKHFSGPTRNYVLDDVDSYLTLAIDATRFTAVLCYSSFQYFSPETARSTLLTIRERFTNVKAVLLGNLPDRQRIHKFYFAEKYVPGIENDHQSPIGMWRTQAEVHQLAHSCGWQTRFEFMPAAFYAAHYRFDAILTRR